MRFTKERGALAKVEGVVAESETGKELAATDVQSFAQKIFENLSKQK